MFRSFPTSISNKTTMSDTNITSSQRKFTMNNGVKMPVIGMGTFRVRTKSDIMHIVDSALAAGYRMFDTAAVYGNETHLKEALQILLPKYGLEREDIFVTTKLAPSDHGGGEITERACYESLERLGLEYIDLYLIHWPGTGGIPTTDRRNAELRDNTWGTLVDIYKDGRFKAIGVSNYTERHLKQLLEKDYGVYPAVNQVEWHPFYYQPELLKYCQDNDIILQAYCSLGGTSVNDKSLLNHPIVANIAKKLNVSNGQVLLAWALQQGVAVIPKASSETHIKNNINLNFKISEEDIILLNNLKINKRKYAWDPNTVH